MFYSWEVFGLAFLVWSKLTLKRNPTFMRCVNQYLLRDQIDKTTCENTLEGNSFLCQVCEQHLCKFPL